MTNLKKIRDDRKLSQSQLSTKSGVGIRLIQQCEQGSRDINKASAINVYHLSKALDCKMEDLLELTKLIF